MSFPYLLIVSVPLDQIDDLLGEAKVTQLEVAVLVEKDIRRPI